MIAYWMSEKSPTIGHVRLRETETDDVDHQQRRNTAEHIDVHRCQETDRSAGWARQQPHHRNYQCPDQDDDLGDHEDLDVDPEALQQRLPSGLVSQGRPSEEDPCNSLIVCSEQPGEKPQRVHRQADADRVPRPVAGTFALVTRRFDLALAREPGCTNRVDHRRDAGRREQQRDALLPSDRSRPGPPAAGRVGRLLPDHSMQAQAVGTSTNGTVDGSPPRYLAINALIDPSSMRPWMIGS